MLESDECLSELSESDFDDKLDVTESENEEEFVHSIEDPSIPGSSGYNKRTENPNIRPGQAKRNKKNSSLNTNKTKSTPALRQQEVVCREPGVTEHVASDEPIDFFELIVTDQLIDFIVGNTNLYATQFLDGNIFSRTSRIFKWETVTAIDVLLFCSVDFQWLRIQTKGTSELHQKQTI